MRRVLIISILILASCGKNPADSPCGPFTLRVLDLTDSAIVSLSAADTTYIVLERTANPKQEQIPLSFTIVADGALSTQARLVLELRDSTHYPERLLPEKRIEQKGDSVFIWYSHFPKPKSLAKASAVPNVQCSPPPQQEFTFKSAIIYAPPGRNVSFIERKR
jgi:hypothetical protein